MNADRKAVSVLSLLDMSAAFNTLVLDLPAAFDTLDHDILLKDSTFGITGQALKWFSSYLSDRHQSVAVDNFRSHPLPLKYGVPQGSVLGPVLFTAYTEPLSGGINNSSSET